MPEAGSIYLITNKVNGKRYIGCTVCPISKRWGEHVRAASRGSPYAIHRAIRKYGEEKFIVEEIATVNGSREELMTVEISIIAKYGTMAPNGYNLTPGGDGVDLSVPEIYARYEKAHAEAMRKLPSDPKWVERHGAAMREVARRPEWMRKRKGLEFYLSADWLKNVSEGNRRKAVNPEWLKANAESNRKKAASPLRPLSRGTLLVFFESFRHQNLTSFLEAPTRLACQPERMLGRLSVGVDLFSFCACFFRLHRIVASRSLIRCRVER